ncbi:ATP-binding protein [Candidatus Woesearchaeota archaeon]|nr:ATP-binding protein [Candidatus Woesearchaeota archaeon]
MSYDIIIGRDEDQIKELENKGLIFLGKQYVKMGQFSSLSNKIMLDVNTSHIILISGKRGSGKSYALSVIAEEMSHLPQEIKNNLSILIMDTMGIFWSMKYPNTKQEDELRLWGMKPQGLGVKVYTPLGKFKEYKEKGIPTDFSFSIRPSELSANDWINVFNLEITEPIGVLIERIISDLSGNYDIEDIIKKIQKEKKSNQEIKNAAENRFKAAESWGIFDKKASEIKDIVKGGQVSILDTSCYDDFNIKALVTGILSKKLLQERMTERKKEEMSRIQAGEHFLVKEEQDFPMVWILLDEAHELLPKKGNTPATDALVQILREGRQPGISMVLATQQPGEIHKDVLTQSDIVISFRLTAKVDIEALNSIMQTYLTSDILGYLNSLPDIKGAGIILDDNSERIYPFKTRPKLSWHGGDAPSAVKVKKKILDIGL